MLFATQAVALFLGKLRTQTIVDVAATNSLRKTSSGIASITEIKSLILSEIGTQSADNTSFDKIGAKDICFDSISCGARVRIVGGCYDPLRREFFCSSSITNLSCFSPTVPSVFATTEVFSSGSFRSFMVSVAHMLGFEASVDALAYGGTQIIIRNQPEVKSKASQCRPS